MPVIFQVDTIEIQRLVDVLREVKKSALPNATKDTVNDLAFDLKQKQLIPSAQQNFILRAPNFIRGNSTVKKATDRNRPIAEAGMIDKGQSSNFHEQEVGGALKHAAIPFDTSRLSASRAKKVAKRYYLSQGSIIDKRRRKRPQMSRKANMIADAAFAYSHKLFMFSGLVLSEVRSFKRNKKGVPKFKLRSLYNVKSNRTVKVEATHFVKEAGEASLQKTEEFFKLAADRQITKAFEKKK